MGDVGDDTSYCMKRMGMGGGIGFLVGGAGGAMFGAYEIMRIRGAQYNQRVGYVGNRILTMGGGFGFFLAVGSGFWCARSIRR